MSLSAALEEVYASGDEEGVVIDTVEIDHVSFDGPVLWARRVLGLADDDAVIMLPIEEGGDPVAHTPGGFRLVRPGADKKGPTDGRIILDGVSGQLYPLLKAALGHGEPITICFRQYRVLPGQLDAVTGPDEEIAGLQLQSVSLSATQAEGTVAWPDGRKMNVPTGPEAFFDRDNYPGLFS